MKSVSLKASNFDAQVAPFVGAWIEISIFEYRLSSLAVAPFVGAWIEIHDNRIIKVEESVAPFVGAWIEI